MREEERMIFLKKIVWRKESELRTNAMLVYFWGDLNWSCMPPDFVLLLLFRYK